MARQPRFVLPGQPHHVVQRGNDRQAIFLDSADQQRYLDYLLMLAREKGVAIHAYVLMTNHVHLLVTPTTADALSEMMKGLAGSYARWFNTKHGRTGTLWEGRFRSSLIQQDAHFMACMRYIELNPVRSGLATSPQQYPWSSYRHHAGLEVSPTVSDHSLYWALGNTPFDREAAYREFVAQGIASAEYQEISSAWKSALPYGSSDFKVRLAQESGCRVEPGRRGRPAILELSTKLDSSVPI
jgi:putative transposase